MNIINCTPHEINVHTPSKVTYSFPPSGQVARVSQEIVVMGEIDGIEIKVAKNGEVTGLPDILSTDVLLIVSAMVKSALPNRKDLVSPGPLIRNDAGQPIGCDGFLI
jgi:hypothetical protein